MAGASLLWLIVALLFFPAIPFAEFDFLDAIGEASNVVMAGLFSVFIARSKLQVRTKLYLVTGMACMFIGGSADVMDEFFIIKHLGALLENIFKTLAAVFTLFGLLRLAREAKLSLQRAEHFRKVSGSMTLLTEVGRELTSSLAMNDVLQIIYNKLQSSVHMDQFKVSLLIDGKLTTFLNKDKGNDCETPEVVEQALMPLQNWVCQNETSMYMFDTDRCLDKYFADQSERDIFEKARRAHSHYLAGTLFIVPIKMDLGLVGIFVIHLHDTMGLDSYQCQNIESIASYAAIAITNALSHKRLETQNDELENAYVQLKDTQQNLLEAEKGASLGRLVAGVSQEMNTPLGNAITSESALRQQLKQVQAKFDNKQLTQVQFKHFLQHCNDSLDLVSTSLAKLKRLINNFRQIYLVQTDETKTKFDLVRKLREVEATMKMDSRAKKFYINFNLPSNLIMEGYPGVIQEVIEHLYENVMLHQFNPGYGAQINVSAEFESDDWLLICFEDNGRGGESEYQLQEFASTDVDKTVKAAGFGLSIVLNLVQKVLAGSIELNNADPNSTKFEIRIPRHDDAALPPL